jgi:hypothetical protein
VEESLIINHFHDYFIASIDHFIGRIIAEIGELVGMVDFSFSECNTEKLDML